MPNWRKSLGRPKQRSTENIVKNLAEIVVQNEEELEAQDRDRWNHVWVEAMGLKWPLRSRRRWYNTNKIGNFNWARDDCRFGTMVGIKPALRYWRRYVPENSKHSKIISLLQWYCACRTRVVSATTQIFKSIIVVLSTLLFYKMPTRTHHSRVFAEENNRQQVHWSYLSDGRSAGCDRGLSSRPFLMRTTGYVRVMSNNNNNQRVILNDRRIL